MAKKKTSKRLATIASKFLDMDFEDGLVGPHFWSRHKKEIKALAASVLSQYEHEQGAVKGKKR